MKNKYNNNNNKFNNSNVYEDNQCDDKTNIVVENNNIYFYSDIDIESILELTTEIKKLELQMIKMKTEFNLDETPKIFLYIQSNGGDLHAGLSGMDTIMSCKVPIITICDGFVASAATLLLLGGCEIKMKKHAYVLIHQLRSEFWGKFNEMCDDMTNNQLLMDTLINIYKSKSTLTTKKLQSLLQKELYLDAQYCLDVKLINEIL